MIKDQKVVQVGMIRNCRTRAQAQGISRAHTVPPCSVSCSLAYAQHSVSNKNYRDMSHVTLPNEQDAP